MPSHVHLVIARHHYDVEQFVGKLKQRATMQLSEEALHPFQHLGGKIQPLPTPWGGRCRKIYCFEPEEVREEIDYVKRNPLKSRMREQRWRFVVPYEG